MGKITRFLKRLSIGERETLEEILRKIEQGDLIGLDVKKLKGGGGLFRVREGSIRIIFLKEDKTTRLISIDRRSNGTYKNL